MGARVAINFDCFLVAWPVGPGCQRGGGPYLCRSAKQMKWTVAGPGQAPVPSGAASGTVSVAVGGLPGVSQERLKTVPAWVPGWAGSRGRVVAGRLGRGGDRPETDAALVRWPAGSLWCCSAICTFQPGWESWGRLRVSILNNRPMELAGYEGSLKMLKCRRSQFHLFDLVGVCSHTNHSPRAVYPTVCHFVCLWLLVGVANHCSRQLCVWRHFAAVG